MLGKRGGGCVRMLWEKSRVKTYRYCGKETLVGRTQAAASEKKRQVSRKGNSVWGLREKYMGGWGFGGVRQVKVR
jgi:hypothetical protein